MDLGTALGLELFHRANHGWTLGKRGVTAFVGVRCFMGFRTSLEGFGVAYYQ